MSRTDSLKQLFANVLEAHRESLESDPMRTLTVTVKFNSKTGEARTVLIDRGSEYAVLDNVE